METDQTITVGVDGSDHSRAALRWAAEEAQRRSAPLKIVHAWEHSPNYVVPTRMVLDDATNLLEEAVRAVANFGVTVVPRLVEGPPAKTLVKESAGAALLVLGSHGLGRVAEAFLGSVSQACIHDGSCPVVVIPVAMVQGLVSPAEAGTVS